MRYCNQICSMHSVAIKDFNHNVYMYFRYPVDEMGTDEFLKSVCSEKQCVKCVKVY